MPPWLGQEESRWRRILEYFSGATQIGMTATPKETKYISNLSYFGDPIYTYSLKEGIDDGFLAPFKVINIMTDIGDGWRPRKGQRDIYGNEIPDRIYTNSDYDYNIIIEDRIQQVAAEITSYLKSTDSMSKTIVFCANEDAAERMRMALINCNADMVKKNPDYVVRITGSDAYGKSKLKYFISTSSEGPVIATTSELLSTGADCKMVKLIVLDKMIGSMTEFKQIIGRGTRLREKEGKTHFAVMDFRNVTHLFADPKWDGPLEIDPNFGTEKPQKPPKPEDGEPSIVDPPVSGPTPHCGSERLQGHHRPQNGLHLRRQRQAAPAGEHCGLHQGKRAGRICIPGQLYPPVERPGQEGGHPRPAPGAGNRPGGHESRAEHGRCGRLRLHLPCGL